MGATKKSWYHRWVLIWREEGDDLLGEPGTAYACLQETKYEAEQDLADKYRSFVAELLHLSLGGVAVFAFLKKNYMRRSPL